MPPPVFDTVIVNGRLVTPAGLVGAALGIRAGKIAAIGQLPHPPGATLLDAQGHTVLPGLVDPHTHPGNYRSFEEEIASETLSAAAGGVTTLIGTVKSTRLGSPYKPYTDPDDVVSYHKVFPPAVAAIQRSASVDVALTPIIMSDEHAREIPEYRREHGITSFKFFVVGHAPSPWSRRIGMPVVVDEGTIFLGLRQVAAAGGLAMIHAENRQAGRILHEDLKGSGRGDLAAWEAGSPDLLEASEIRKAAYLCRHLGCPLYVVHLTSRLGLRTIRALRGEGTTIWAETCTHYLVFHKGMTGPRSLLLKASPPIRSIEDQEALWGALADGFMDCLGSDHAAGFLNEKTGDGDIWSAYPGMPGIELMLPVLLSEGVLKGRITLPRLAELCATNPARAFGLFPAKGAIQVGADADLVIVDLAKKQRVRLETLHQASDFSPYEGMELQGWPVLTMLRGQVIIREGVVIRAGLGDYLSR